MVVIAYDMVGVQVVPTLIPQPTTRQKSPDPTSVPLTLRRVHRYALALPTLTVPAALTTTVGRPWLVPFMTLPVWARWAAFFPALMSTVLLFMDQNITVRLVNAKQHKLKKG